MLIVKGFAMNLSTRIIIMITGSLIILAALLGFATKHFMEDNVDFFAKVYHENMIDVRKEELKSEMQIVHTIVKTIYEDQKSLGQSDEQIIETIKKKLINVRFFNDNSGYIFIYDSEGNCILLPTNTSLHGTNMIKVEDSDGKFFLQELIETAKKGRLCYLSFPKSQRW